MIPSKFGLAFFSLILASISTSATAALTVANGQFSTKLYTEALGRIPDIPGWSGTKTFWASNSCNGTTLKTLANNILTSSEFLNLSPTNHEKVYRLYRATLHRDANASEFTSQVNALISGTPWSTVINSVLNSTEFTNRVTVNCSGSSVGWQNTPAYNQVVTSTGNVTTEIDLRNRLAAAAPGSTVYLEQGAVIALNSPLIVPPGITLTTTGEPGQRKAPLLGRLVRNWTSTWPTEEQEFLNNRLIVLSDNSKLKSVWVDGQRHRFAYKRQAMNIFADGSNVEVSNNIISDTTGWTNLQYLARTSPCDNGLVYSNLITAYTSSHFNSQWADGISIGCKNVTVQENQIIDATDVGIVVYHNYPNIQTSKVLNNHIFNAGNSAYGGIVTDPLMQSNLPSLPLSEILNFTGTQFSNNRIWSSPSVHLDFVISNGTRPWFGSTSFTGKGAQFINNTSGGDTVTAVVGIAVSGMLESYVHGNNFSTISAPSQYSGCVLRNVVVAPMPYGNDSLSSTQAPHSVVAFNDPIVVGCIGH